MKTYARPSANVAVIAIFLFLAIFRSQIIGNGKQTTHISKVILKAAEKTAIASRLTHVPVIVLSQFERIG